MCHFLRRMHKPGDERRSLVIVQLKDYDIWLECRDPKLARTCMIQQTNDVRMQNKHKNKQRD